MFAEGALAGIGGYRLTAHPQRVRQLRRFVAGPGAAEDLGDPEVMDMAELMSDYVTVVENHL